MKRRDRTARSLATQLSRLARISQANGRSADCRVRRDGSKTFIVRRRAPKGPNRSAPLVSRHYMVAGAGFEPDLWVMRGNSLYTRTKEKRQEPITAETYEARRPFLVGLFRSVDFIDAS